MLKSVTKTSINNLFFKNFNIIFMKNKKNYQNINFFFIYDKNFL